MASTSTASSTPNMECEPEIEDPVAPPSIKRLKFIYIESTSTSSTPNPEYEEIVVATSVPSPSDTHAFELLVPSTSTSARSTSIPNRKLPYDVFINHRGPDVKRTLAAKLYNTLTGMGLRVFLDNEELEIGDFLPAEIEEAMRSASLHIAIFSQNYADSPWCLTELFYMLKTGTKIVPVFYHVQPDDVRYAKGVYAKAFSRHLKKGRYTKEKLQEWKNALNTVSFNMGYIIHNDNDEGPLMKKIVGAVLKKIKNVPFVVANRPIGLDEAAQDFEKRTLQCTENSNNVQIVGIWGMGGSGKTSLAKHLYNKKCKLMDKSSFIVDVRDASSKSKLHKKQKKLLEDLGLSGVSIESVEEGQGILANQLRSIRVLIVLDDVDSVDQLNALVPNKESLESGSLILVTSRELEVLRCWGISSSSIYKMKPLDPFHAKQLFCWHAFLQPSPYQGFEDLVQKFLNNCDGLPLSLKVFGSQLHGISNKDYWKEQLQKISRILPKDIKERLKVSYDALDNEEKQIFLDIACLFIGEKRSSAIAAWDGLGWNGLHSWEQLFNKCLVELNDDGDYIKMHDHLRDLGREIANNQPPYRLWSPQQIINVGNEVRAIGIRGIMGRAAASTSDNEEFLECSQDGQLIFKASGVNYSVEPSSLGLKIFHVRGNYYNKIVGDISRGLVWLRWQDIEQRSLQTFSSLENLRVLELHEKFGGENHLEELWDSDSNAPVQLRELFINCCEKFQGFPKSIGCLRYLKKIIITDDDMVRSLPEEFCLLQSLEHFELGGPELSSLPSNFGDLRNLRHLAFRHCVKLRRLPLSFKKLTLLQYLSLSWCYELNLESDILENMTRLVFFKIDGSKQLEELPRNITNQASLTELHCKIERLKELPVDIGQLLKLRKLKIQKGLFTSLPTSIGHLSSLTSLEISNCDKLESLPMSIGHLSSLTSLEISNCDKLESLPTSIGHLSSLTSLEISNCDKLESLATIEHLSSLTSLKIWGCDKLESLSTPIGHLSSQTSLTIQGCDKLEFLPMFIGHLSSPTSIMIRGCDKLESLPTSIGHLSSLTSLKIQGCDTLESLPTSIGDLSSLTSLKIQDCDKLESLPTSIGHLSSLTHLYISGCRKLECLPESLSRLHLLEELKIEGVGVKCLPKQLVNLQYLKISECPISELRLEAGLFSFLKKIEVRSTDVAKISISTDLPQLEWLDIGKNRHLKEIEGLPNTLKSLSLMECPKLEVLPSFAQLASLEVLTIMECCRVKKIEGLEHCGATEGFRNVEAGLFTCLKGIEVSSTGVAKISISTDLPQLEWLYIGDNRHLTEIEGLPNKLKCLYLRSCPKLEVLPSFAQLGSLEELEITSCYGVKKIEGLEHCGATERFRKVQLQTMSGSGFEGFFQSMKKCPKECIDVCTRAVGDAATILNSFAFSNLSLIHSFANEKSCSFYNAPSAAPCILLYFVVNCTSCETRMQLRLNGIRNVELELRERGKWVWTALLTKRYEMYERDEIYGMSLGRGGEVERGVIVMGEDENAWQAFNHLRLVLAN